VSKYDKASEKFSAAVRTLAVRDLPLKERLVGALESIKRLDVEDLPEDMREDFQRLKESDPERMSDPRQIYQYACDYSGPFKQDRHASLPKHLGQD
jgi:hypothetical protein